VTLMGVIVNQRLPEDARVRGQSVHRLPPDLRDGLAHALQPAFLAAALLCVVTLAIVVLWLEEVPLQKELDSMPGSTTPETGQPEVVTQDAR
jgi:peptidoglycan/LPS O-acetylase OafA/YrhL